MNHRGTYNTRVPWIHTCWAAAGALLLGGVFTSACGDRGDLRPSHSATGERSAPTQKRPDINARFLDPKLDVDRWVARFEREQREVFKHRSAIVSTLDLKAGQAVADIGAGTGAFSAELAARVGASGRVFALDISPRFIERLRARVRAEGLAQVTVKRSKPDDLTLPAGSIDAAFVCDTYHHFDNPAAILKTIFEALKPGGRLVIVDFHRIEGKTKKWLMEHVRAGQEVFAAEISAAGFRRLPDPPHDFLVDNYLMVFERP